MSRTRRVIKSRALYEVSFRAVNTIPLVCADYMNVLLRSILARVQRDQKVLLHHFVFEGSHAHILCTALDANQCRKFYGEVKKQITEAVKCLMGIERLSLWEDRPGVILVPTYEDAVAKIVYIYANPSNDCLEDSIDAYPGVTSWDGFLQALGENGLRYAHSRAVPWIRQGMIPKLPSGGAVTERQDRFLAEKMLEDAKRRGHSFILYPNAWMASVSGCVEEDFIAETNREILRRLRSVEAHNREQRSKAGKQVMGVYRLKTQQILKPHTPKMRGIQIFVHSQFKDVRIQIIQERKVIEAECREVYERWKCGDFSRPWPPGTFPPPVPVLVNLLQDYS